LRKKEDIPKGENDSKVIVSDDDKLKNRMEMVVLKTQDGTEDTST
jgi:hypothetical protein